MARTSLALSLRRYNINNNLNFSPVYDVLFWETRSMIYFFICISSFSVLPIFSQTEPQRRVGSAATPPAFHINKIIPINIRRVFSPSYFFRGTRKAGQLRLPFPKVYGMA